VDSEWSRSKVSDALAGYVVCYSTLYMIAVGQPAWITSFAINSKLSSWYRALGFSEASSHSGRWTAITNWARKIRTVGESLRDVQMLNGHSALSTTQRYIEGADGARRRMLN